MPSKSYYQNKDDLTKEVKIELEKGKAKTGGRIPQVLIMGLWEDVELVPSFLSCRFSVHT